MNFPDTPVCEMPFFRGDLRDSNHCAFSKSTCIYLLFEPLRYSCIRLIVMFICVAMITCPKSLRFSQYTFLRSYLTLPSCAYFDFLGPIPHVWNWHPYIFQFSSCKGKITALTHQIWFMIHVHLIFYLGISVCIRAALMFGDKYKVLVGFTEE